MEDAAREAGSVDLPMHEVATLGLLVRRLREACHEPDVAADYEARHGRPSLNPNPHPTRTLPLTLNPTLTTDPDPHPDPNTNPTPSPDY